MGGGWNSPPLKGALMGWVPCNTTGVQCHVSCMACFGDLVICQNDPFSRTLFPSAQC